MYRASSRIDFARYYHCEIDDLTGVERKIPSLYSLACAAYHEMNDDHDYEEWDRNYYGWEDYFYHVKDLLDIVRVPEASWWGTREGLSTRTHSNHWPLRTGMEVRPIPDLIIEVAQPYVDERRCYRMVKGPTPHQTDYSGVVAFVGGPYFVSGRVDLYRVGRDEILRLISDITDEILSISGYTGSLDMALHTVYVSNLLEPPDDTWLCMF